MAKATKKQPAKRRTKKQAEPVRVLFAVTLRGKRELASNGVTFTGETARDAMEQALACTKYPQAEPILSWDGKDQVACLDLDFHRTVEGKETYKPTGLFIEQQILRLPVQPAFFWVSHGGGAKLLFFGVAGLSAEDQAEIGAALLEKTFNGYSAFSGSEIKRDTRHPAFGRPSDTLGIEHCGSVREGSSSDLDTAKRRLFKSYSDDDFDSTSWDEYTESKGWNIGGRLYHHDCPIAPSEHPDTCIQIGERHLFCHRCNGVGRCWPGISLPGYIPAAVLLDGKPIPPKTTIAAAVDNFCHFEHARHYFPELSELRARTRYRAFLRLRHGEDPRVGLAFKSYGIIRLQGQWCNKFGEPQSDVKTTLRALPAGTFADDKGKVRTALDKLGMLSHTRTDDIGYRSLIAIRGVNFAERIWRCDQEEAYYYTLPCNPPIKILPKVSDDEFAWAKAHIEKKFDGINFDYLRLCICAKGVSQWLGHINIPRTVVKGASGCGKTATIRLAAILTGEEFRVVEMSEKLDEFKRSYGDFSRETSLVCIDEFEKKGSSFTDGKMLQFLTVFEGGMTYRPLYSNWSRVETPAAVFLCGTGAPQALFTPEIARRYVFVELADKIGGVKWKDSCGTAGMETWLTGEFGTENRKARDILVSHVIQQFFSGGYQTYEAMAAKLGFGMIKQSDDFSLDIFKRLWQAYLAHPEFEGNSRWQGPGWRRFNRNDGSELSQIMHELDAFNDQSRINAAPWAAITGVEGEKAPSIRPSQHNNGDFAIKFGKYKRENLEVYRQAVDTLSEACPDEVGTLENDVNDDAADVCDIISGIDFGETGQDFDILSGNLSGA